jgi:hypothetical protein
MGLTFSSHKGINQCSQRHSWRSRNPIRAVLQTQRSVVSLKPPRPSPILLYVLRSCVDPSRVPESKSARISHAARCLFLDPSGKKPVCSQSLPEVRVEMFKTPAVLPDMAPPERCRRCLDDVNDVVHEAVVAGDQQGHRYYVKARASCLAAEVTVASRS